MNIQIKFQERHAYLIIHTYCCNWVYYLCLSQCNMLLVRIISLNAPYVPHTTHKTVIEYSVWLTGHRMFALVNCFCCCYVENNRTFLSCNVCDNVTICLNPSAALHTQSVNMWERVRATLLYAFVFVCETMQHTTCHITSLRTLNSTKHT